VLGSAKEGEKGGETELGGGGEQAQRGGGVSALT